MPEKKQNTVICDYCEEEWEEDFFCEKCSNKWCGTEIVDSPKLFWDGSGSDMEEVEEDIYSGDVCGNCCKCHLK